MLTKFELASLIGKRAIIIETTGIHKAKNISTEDNITAIIIA